MNAANLDAAAPLASVAGRDSVIGRVEGQEARRLQLNASNLPWPHSLQRSL